MQKLCCGERTGLGDLFGRNVTTAQGKAKRAKFQFSLNGVTAGMVQQLRNGLFQFVF